jgi:hypothetical protein
MSIDTYYKVVTRLYSFNNVESLRKELCMKIYHIVLSGIVAICLTGLIVVNAEANGAGSGSNGQPFQAVADEADAREAADNDLQVQIDSLTAQLSTLQELVDGYHAANPCGTPEPIDVGDVKGGILSENGCVSQNGNVAQLYEYTVPVPTRRMQSIRTVTMSTPRDSQILPRIFVLDATGKVVGEAGGSIAVVKLPSSEGTYTIECTTDIPAVGEFKVYIK